MISYLNTLEVLGADIDGESQVDMILQSLPESFKEFRLNYNMNKKIYTLSEMMNELVAAEGILVKGSVDTNMAETSSSKPKLKGKGGWKKKNFTKKEGKCRHRILSAFNLRAKPKKFQKILFSLHGAMKTSRLMWHNPFGHQSTQSAFFGQNAPGQPWVNQKSNEVKILSKQHFSWFYIKPELLRDFCQL